MKNVTRHIGTLEIIERLPSRNSNPRYLLRIDGWTCRTRVDSSHACVAPIYNGKRVIATIGAHYGKSTVDTLRLAGNLD